MTDAEDARDAAIEDVRRGAPVEWLAAAMSLIRSFPPGRLFTTDALWEKLPAPPEPRAMGAVIRHAADLGLIRSTGHYWKSGRVQCHARPVAVWERVEAGDTPPG